jgi:hypothetical protein
MRNPARESNEQEIKRRGSLDQPESTIADVGDARLIDGHEIRTIRAFFELLGNWEEESRSDDRNSG